MQFGAEDGVLVQRQRLCMLRCMHESLSLLATPPKDAPWFSLSS